MCSWRFTRCCAAGVIACQEAVGPAPGRGMGGGRLLDRQAQRDVVIARWLGIGRGANLVMYLAVLGGLFVSWYFYNRYRRLEILVTNWSATTLSMAPRKAAQHHRRRKTASTPIEDTPPRRRALAPKGQRFPQPRATPFGAENSCDGPTGKRFLPQRLARWADGKKP